MIVLASASPRRRELLRAAGVPFRVEPAGVDEELALGTPPEPAACLLAERKARAVAGRLSGPAWVVGADTIVAVAAPGGGERILGKPADEAEARAMLASLAGTRHRVVTGVSIVRVPGEGAVTASETTWVRMRPLADDEIGAYVATGEWRDKAGGYAIQESADAFVLGLDGGGFDNVVGLPVALTLELLRRDGAEPPGPPGKGKGVYRGSRG